MFSASKSNTLNSPESNNSFDECSSPSRKRIRFDHEGPDFEGVAGHWSLDYDHVDLNDILDCGVAKLEGNDLKESNIKLEASPSEQYSETLSELQETFDNITNSEWEEFTVQKAQRELGCKINYFDDLSDEMILNIFHFLPKRTLHTIARVCRRFNQLSQDDSLWSRMDISKSLLQPGAIGHILSRQVIILRLAQSEICDPLILNGVRAADPNFRARLMYLDLSMAQVGAEGLTELFSRCRRLRKVSLENCTVDDSVLMALSYSKELEVLNLAMAEGIQADGVNYLLSNCRNLKELNMAWTYLNSSTVKFACQNFPPSLNRLNLSGCRKMLTDESVQDLVKCCSGLRELDLSDCTGLTGDSIRFLVKLDNLNFLALSRCYFIPHTSLLSLKKMGSLMYLDVHGGYIEPNAMLLVQKSLEPNVTINKFKFSSIARPTVAQRRTSIWGLSVR